MKTEVEILKEKLEIAKKALIDIVEWDEYSEMKWEDQGELAMHTLTKLK